MTIVQRTPQLGAWMGPVIGRRPELEAARQFLADLSNGPAHLVLEGPAGIGKSTIWNAAVAMARADGVLVLSARPSRGDAGISWAGLSDLLAHADDAPLDGLLEPQRRALEIALSRRQPDGGPLDELSVRLAIRALLGQLAATGNLVVAIDDLQWLDAATTAVLAFALKRMDPGRVGLLAAIRTAGRDALAEAEEAAGADQSSSELIAALRDGKLRRIAVDRLDDDPLRAIVRDEVEPGTTRSVVDEICRVSGGNPLYAIELARSGNAAGASGLRAVVERRFADLVASARELATVIAIAGPLTWVDARALASGTLAEADLDAAIRAGFLVSGGGLVSFTHPLLESVVANAASEPQRQRIHRAYADRWPEREETPRHLAAATTDFDPAIAARLDEAADQARRRGAPLVAAARYFDAARLTPPEDTDARARREIEGALASFAGGETAVARGRLESVAQRMQGPRRSEALWRLAGVIWAAEGFRPGIDAFYRALPEAAGSPAIEGDIHDNLAWLVCSAGDMPKAYEHVQTARDIAERLGDPGLLARVLDKYAQIEFQIGKGSGLEMSARASEYEASIGPAGDAAQDRLIILMWSDRLDESRIGLTEHLDRAIADGNVRFQQEMRNILAILEYRAGNFVTARAHLGKAIDFATDAGLGTAALRRTLARIDVVQGEPDRALEVMAEQLPNARAGGDGWGAIHCLYVTGVAHAALGNIEAAADALDEAWTLCQQVGVEEVGIFRVGADAVEVLIEAGRLDRAQAVLATFERQSRAAARPWGLATAPRGRALIDAARKRPEAALASAAEAIGLSERLGQPFELARALLVAGRIERRLDRRREARAHLHEAAATFDRLAAPLWAKAARDELQRISGRAPSAGGLTPTERQIANLVVDGLTNREVAARLFVSVRTVETNLTRVYEKLEVRSRTELTRKLSADAGALGELATSGTR